MGGWGLEREQTFKLHFWQCSLSPLQKAGWGVKVENKQTKKQKNPNFQQIYRRKNTVSYQI